MEKIKVALVQAEPAMFNLEKGIEKIAAYTQAAKLQERDLNLVVFPEAYLPGYPRGMGFGTVVGSRTEKGKKIWLSYSKNAVTIPGFAINQLGEIAKANAVYLVVGLIEKEEIGGTLYCTLVYFDPKGNLIGKHRKIKPTAAERIIWGEGDGKDLDVYDLPIGRLGGLICWENYMPLARMALYQQGIQIYLAPTADQRESWQATMKHIACEGRCFVLGCNQFVQKDMIPDVLWEDIPDIESVYCRGGSIIVDPFGNTLAGPLFDSSGILYATLDLDLAEMGKMDFDVTGHYARSDIFRYEYFRP